MNHSLEILNLAKKNNGVITTAMVVAAGFPRGSLKYLADNGRLERASRGVYTLPEVWEDEFVNLQSRFIVLEWRYCYEKCDAAKSCYCKREESICAAGASELYVGALLERVSISDYQDNFIIKGGFLIASMVGLDSRAVKDMDATIKRYPVSKETIQKMAEKIIKIKLDDDITFTFKSISEIREGDEYTGYRIALSANHYQVHFTVCQEYTGFSELCTGTENNGDWDNVREGGNRYLGCKGRGAAYDIVLAGTG